MAQVNLGPPLSSSLCCLRKTQQPLWRRPREDATSWSSLRNSLQCNGRFTCLLWDNHKQEQARKALEDALGGKKSELDKWDKEIRKREEEEAAGGGGGGGGRGGGGGWFRWWSNGDHFWQEAQQASLAVLGIILVYLIIAKGEVMLAVILNPLLFALRGTRNAFAFLATHMSGKGEFENVTTGDANYDSSAKSRVLRKWGSDQ
ncbi:uncharacterized protein LOC124912241 [Impatiens glandulifera]|uniref:uncharacterized protein LOC124911795 n=1 Tax=Impatiens glandulifera TaxID=253017 RepID=UPI001FB14D82|nr:uncharacterized protein LOC124911795 [Impatiens glandulifera]XP_047308764.1 uncharacterized protein LOC124912241 [Impatiens glandulifera]